MAVLTSLALAAGVGSMAYGLYEKQAGQSKAAEGYAQQQQGYNIQAQAAQQQAGISKEQAASSVQFAGQERDINVLASNQSISASNQSYGINQSTIQSEQQIELQKKQAMEIDGRRQQMEVIRNQQRARAMGLTAATAQGASKGSGLQGGYGQASGQTGVNLLGIQQNLDIGRNIFGFNETISGNRIQQNDLEHSYSLQQAANQTAKANLTYGYAVANAGFQTRLADTQTLMSQGQGYVNRGSGVVSQGQGQIASGNSFFQAGPQLFSMGMNANQLLGGNSGGNFWFGGGSPSGYGGGTNTRLFA